MSDGFVEECGFGLDIYGGGFPRLLRGGESMDCGDPE